MINYDSRPVSWIVGKGTPKTDKDNLIKDKVTKMDRRKMIEEPFSRIDDCLSYEESFCEARDCGECCCREIKGE